MCPPYKLLIDWLIDWNSHLGSTNQLTQPSRYWHYTALRWWCSPFAWNSIQISYINCNWEASLKRIGNCLKRIGNSLKKVGNSLKKIGKIFEKSWKFSTKISVSTDNQYLKPPIWNPVLYIIIQWRDFDWYMYM